MNNDLKLHKHYDLYCLITTTIYILIASSFEIISTVLHMQYNDNIIVGTGVFIVIFDCIMLFFLIKQNLIRK